MEYEIVELDIYSGCEAKIYSIIPRGDSHTIFENFVKEHISGFREEIKDITKKLYTIGNHTGARESFFKDKEGKPGDFIEALYDEPGVNLRAYCMRLGSVAIILGNGGEKTKETRAWQDDEKLTEAMHEMMAYSKDILTQLDNGEIYWSNDLTELEGNLKNYEDE